MNTTTKTLSIAVAMFAIGGLVVAFYNQEAYARPPIDGVGDHVMKINLKGVPNDTDRNCNSGGNNNIYTQYGTDDGGPVKDNTGHQHIIWEHNATDNSVKDHCTENVGTDGDPAIVGLDSGTYMFTIRILGPANDVDKNFLKYCSQIVNGTEVGLHDDSLCVTDVKVMRENGKIKYTLPAGLFDDVNEWQIWSFTTGDRFRNAQIDIWEAP